MGPHNIGNTPSKSHEMTWCKTAPGYIFKMFSHLKMYRKYFMLKVGYTYVNMYTHRAGGEIRVHFLN